MQRKGKGKGKKPVADWDAVSKSKPLQNGWRITGTAVAAAACVAVVSAAIFVNTLGHDFTVDDESTILTYKAVRDHDGPIGTIFAHDYWGTPMHSADSHKSFRPITTLSFRMSHYLYGWSLEYWHAENIILHSAVSVVFFAVTHVVSDGDLVLSFMSSMLFATHPVHVEAVASLAHRAELFCALFFLAGVLGILGKSWQYISQLAVAGCCLHVLHTLCAVQRNWIYFAWYHSCVRLRELLQPTRKYGKLHLPKLSHCDDSICNSWMESTALRELSGAHHTLDGQSGRMAAKSVHTVPFVYVPAYSTGWPPYPSAAFTNGL